MDMRYLVQDFRTWVGAEGGGIDRDPVGMTVNPIPSYYYYYSARSKLVA